MYQEGTSRVGSQSPGARRFPRLFSELPLRGQSLKNRIVFPPTCPSWVSDPQSARFNDLAAPYYEERASGGVGQLLKHRAQLLARPAPLRPQVHDHWRGP